MTGKELYWLLDGFRETACCENGNLFLSVSQNPDAGSPEDEHLRLEMVDKNGVPIDGACPLAIIHQDGVIDSCSVTVPEKIGPIVALKRALRNRE